ncbi:MAG: SIS domain-containing protein [Streptococcaceae bacterium]|nr:SIS domain-containing protein [Streptococcaceae bacterium]
MFKLSDDKLSVLGALITTREIEQQPELWAETLQIYQREENEINAFLKQLVDKHSYLRVIFTGGGTSQYVGDVVYRSLVKLGDKKHFRFDSIGSTDIVSSPETTLEKEAPTLLVSFARSGNSPESLAAVDLVSDYVDDVYHIIMTCAKDGELAKQTNNREDALVLLLPEKSNDKGFAMTGSCTSMILLATLVFSTQSATEKEAQVKGIIAAGKDIISREEEVANYLPKDVKRVVYVGSGPAAALAREAQLKILELTAGQIATIFDSSMGLRHGPKSFINFKTAAYVFVANDSYTKEYDLDIYRELKADDIAETVVMIGQNVSEGFSFSSDEILDEAFLVFPFLVFAQIISLNASINVGNTPDTPSATGTVNRVVKGVSIHPYH